jgi:hypothetical protein
VGHEQIMVTTTVGIERGSTPFLGTTNQEIDRHEVQGWQPDLPVMKITVKHRRKLPALTGYKGLHMELMSKILLF